MDKTSFDDIDYLLRIYAWFKQIFRCWILFDAYQLPLRNYYKNPLNIIPLKYKDLFLIGC